MKTDLIIVGGGILGLAAAFKAIEKGLSVRVVDRSERPVGSSIMNFGHACFTGQADSVQQMAMASREGWLKAAEKTGLWAAESGTYVVAKTDVEMSLLEEFARHRGEEQVRLLECEQVARGIGNPRLDAIGGALLPLDMRINPREAAPRLAGWLEASGVIFNWRHEVLEIAEGRVKANRGQFLAEQIFVCPNIFLTQLYPDLADKFDLRVCSLAMSLIERPVNIPQELAMFTGTSLARYDGFAAMSSVDKLRKELSENESELVACTANLMATAGPDGIFIGDSHHYELSPEPFVDESEASLLIGKAADYLGIERPVVKQRWQGRYSDSPITNFIIERADEGVTVAVVASGIGMTMAFGVAELLVNDISL